MFLNSLYLVVQEEKIKSYQKTSYIPCKSISFWQQGEKGILVTKKNVNLLDFLAAK